MSQLAGAPRIPGRFEIREEIGKGGFGLVYRAFDSNLGRDVAIKVSRFSDEEFVRRFRQEAQLAARLNHENIVRIYDYGEDEEGRPYIVQEFLDGTTLLSHLQMLQAPNIALGTRVRWLSEIAAGLAHAHKHQVLHRDIKPGNVRILTSGRAKLLDFGIAKLEYSHSNLTAAHELLGTMDYMAPELFDRRVKEPIDSRADIWSFGVLACETLVGRKPFRAENDVMLRFQILRGDAEIRLVREFPELPEDVLEMLDGCLIVDRARRTASMEEIAAGLEAAYTGLAGRRTSRAMTAGARGMRAESGPPLVIDEARLGNDSWAAQDMPAPARTREGGTVPERSTGRRLTGPLRRSMHATAGFLDGLQAGTLVLRMFTALGMLTACFLLWVGASSVLHDWSARQPRRPDVGAAPSPVLPAVPPPTATGAPLPSPTMTGPAAAVSDPEPASAPEPASVATPEEVAASASVGPSIRADAGLTTVSDTPAPTGTPVVVRVRQPVTLRLGDRVLNLREESQVVRFPAGAVEVVWEAVDPRTGMRREIRQVEHIVAGQRGREIVAPPFSFDGIAVHVSDAEQRTMCVWVNDRLIGATASSVVTYLVPGSYAIYVAPREAGCLPALRSLVREVVVSAGAGVVNVTAVYPANPTSDSPNDSSVVSEAKSAGS